MDSNVISLLIVSVHSYRSVSIVHPSILKWIAISE